MNNCYKGCDENNNRKFIVTPEDWEALKSKWIKSEIKEERK
jgi:hypothetical protein